MIDAAILMFMGARTVDPVSLLVATLFTVLAEVMRAVRLSIIADCGLKCTPRAFIARAAGNAIALVTPSALGGEVVKGVVLVGWSSRALIIGLYDSLSDLWSNVTLALVLLPLSFTPITFALTLIGVGASIAWVAVLKIAKRIRVLKLISTWLGGETGRSAASSLGGWLLGAAILLGILAHVVVGVGLALAKDIAVLKSVSAIVYGLLAGIAPVPGGLVTIDVVIALHANPDAAVLWRLSYLASTLPGLAILFRLKPLLRRD